MGPLDSEGSSAGTGWLFSVSPPSAVKVAPPSTIGLSVWCGLQGSPSLPHPLFHRPPHNRRFLPIFPAVGRGLRLGGRHPEPGLVGKGEDRIVFGGDFRAKGIPAVVPTGRDEVIVEALGGSHVDEKIAPRGGSDPVAKIAEVGVLFAASPEFPLLPPVLGILDGVLVVSGENEGSARLAGAPDLGEGSAALGPTGDVHEPIEPEDGRGELVVHEGQAEGIGYPEAPGTPAGSTQLTGSGNHGRGEVHSHTRRKATLFQAESDPSGPASQFEEGTGQAEPAMEYSLLGAPEPHFLGRPRVVFDNFVPGIIPADLAPFHTRTVRRRLSRRQRYCPRGRVGAGWQGMDLRSSLPPALADPLRALAEEIRKGGGRAVLVGGAVRDLLLGSVPTELDVEVFGLDFAAIERVLRKRFAPVRVGRSFPVLKVRGHPIDVAVPRMEWATGPRHTDFAYRAEPGLDFASAARRRDFTINAISWDPLEGTIIDPVGGRTDLRAGILRQVSEQFGEDALRVLRGMQFAARFDFAVEPGTVETCRTLTADYLARERIFEEWRKLLLRGRKPSRGLFFLEEVGWLRFYPELEATVKTPQDARWHPEGNVWPHTLYALDAFAEERTGDPTEDLVVGLAVLCHDLGKPACTLEERGAIRSPGHEKAGIEPTRTLLARLTAEAFWFEQVEPLVATHMRPRQLYEQRSGPAAIRRLAARVGRIDRLLRVCRADAGGRPPLPRGPFAEGEWLLEEARKLRVEDQRPESLVRGRDLLTLGLDPGPHVGRMLAQLFDEQLEGAFSTREGGMARARELLREH